MAKKDAAYNRRHYRVRAARGRAAEHACVGCAGPAREWAQLHGTDGENPQDYQPMCCKCHQRYDGRWSAEERAKVAESVRQVWASSPDRRVAMAIREGGPR